MLYTHTVSMLRRDLLTGCVCLVLCLILYTQNNCTEVLVNNRMNAIKEFLLHPLSSFSLQMAGRKNGKTKRVKGNKFTIHFLKLNLQMAITKHFLIQVLLQIWKYNYIALFSDFSLEKFCESEFMCMFSTIKFLPHVSEFKYIRTYVYMYI